MKNTHGPSKSEIVTTAPTDVGGTGKYFSPTDLLACSLGCCALTVMSKQAMKMGHNFKGTSVEIEKHVVAEPRRVGKLTAQFTLSSEYSDEEKKILENTAYNSPIALTLKGNVELDLQFRYAD